MVHIIEALIARGDNLSVRQIPGQLVFDYGTSAAASPPGATASYRRRAGSQIRPPAGRRRVRDLFEAQNGPGGAEERYSVSADGKHLTEKLRIVPAELPVVNLKRVYDATSASTARQPTSD